MKRATLLVLLAACGDNLGSDMEAPDFESSFDGESAVFFGDIVTTEPPAPPVPVVGAMICVEGVEECTFSDDRGGFLVSGPGGDVDTVVVSSAPDLLTARSPTRPSPAGDRNIGPVILVSQDTIEESAEVLGVDPQLDARGAVIVFAALYGEGPFSFAIDGATTGYVGDDVLLDPDRTSVARFGVAILFAVPPGEALLRSTAGRCDATMDGWSTDEPGTIRLPVVAGEVTIVHPLCGAASAAR